MKGYDHVRGNVYVKRPKFLFIPDDNELDVVECDTIDDAKEKMSAFTTLYRKYGAIYQKVCP